MWILALVAATSAQVLALEPDTLTAGHFGWLVGAGA